ncbi:rhomboid-like protein [Saccharothrix sp. ST-888]|uniref:rhomboid-like protein n=1 Tax=Saccharothrix sp. ST-888 TaxID=1427391 RepID=UPI0018CF41AA|nr:rhomboid-like protein [Saccharothrix sp. ST-888]
MRVSVMAVLPFDSWPERPVFRRWWCGRDRSDVGVSYALAGVEGVLTYRFAGRWRWAYAGGLLLFYLLPLIRSHTFTDLGHFCAVLIGLGFYGFADGRPTWDPADLWRTRWHRARSPLANDRSKGS